MIPEKVFVSVFFTPTTLMAKMWTHFPIIPAMKKKKSLIRACQALTHRIESKIHEKNTLYIPVHAVIILTFFASFLLLFLKWFYYIAFRTTKKKKKEKQNGRNGF